MNNVTYASPVALPSPVYALGLYRDTQSGRDRRAHGCGLLQAGAAGCSGLRTSACTLCDCQSAARCVLAARPDASELPHQVNSVTPYDHRREMLAKPFLMCHWQILRRQHAELVQLLGKTSSRDVDKLAALADMGFETVDRLGYSSLAGASGHPLIPPPLTAADGRSRVEDHLCWWQVA